MEDASTPGKKRIWLRRALRLVGAAIVLLALVVLFWLRGALYHRFVSFPREEAAWQALRAQRQPVPGIAGLNDYRGILHSHSKYSHDSEVPFEEILRVLKSTGIDFICLSDHTIQGRADFNLQWRGLREGKLFVPGFEMKEGIMPFGVASGIVLSNQTDSATLARQISENGGLMFYALTALYMLAPGSRIYFRQVWVPSLSVAVALQLGQSLFGSYVTKFVNYNAIYGPVGAIMLTLLWVYVAGYIILLGGCYCAAGAGVRPGDATTPSTA